MSNLVTLGASAFQISHEKNRPADKCRWKNYLPDCFRYRHTGKNFPQ